MKASPSLLREPRGRPVMLPEWPRAKRPSLSRCIDFSSLCSRVAGAVQRKPCAVRSGEQAFLCASPAHKSCANAAELRAPCSARSIHNFGGCAFIQKLRFFVKHSFHFLLAICLLVLLSEFSMEMFDRN